MLRILNDEDEIREAQQRFKGVFEKLADEKVPIKMGHRGGRIAGEALWCSKLDIWFYSRIAPTGNRYWNAFGIGKPAKGRNVSITCEINPPLLGINRRVAGVFVTDSRGRIYVGHRGKIGGGKKNIGKALFERYHGEDEWTEVQDGDRETPVVLIGALDSARFARQVGVFVRNVDRMKRLASSSVLDTDPLGGEHQFRREFAGKKEYTVEKRIEAKCDHGLVVNHLETVLRNRGIRTGNDRRDLYTLDSSDRITAIFEVKTDMSSTSLYTGVGQLVLYSVGLVGPPGLVLVIPGRVEEAVEAKLRQLGIRILEYRLSDKEVVFKGLDSLIS